MKKHSLIIAVIFIPIFGMTQTDPGLLKAAFALYEGRPATVIEHVSDAHPTGKHETELYYLTAQAYDALGKSEEALMASKALLNTAYESIAWWIMARNSWKLDNRDQAYAYLRNHLNSEQRLPMNRVMGDPVFVDLERDREWIRFWSGNWYSPKDDLFTEASYALTQNDPDESIFDQLKSQYPDDPHGQLLETQYLINQLNTRMAKRVLESISSADFKTVKLKLELATVYEQLDKNPQAIQTYDDVIALHPYCVEAYIARINLRLQLHQEKAKIELDQLINLGIESTTLYRLKLQYDTSSGQSSLILADRLIAESPLEAIHYNTRASLYQSLQQSDKALADWSMSLDIDPIQPTVYFEIAETYHRLGNRERACYNWKKALQYGNRKAFDKVYTNCR